MKKTAFIIAFISLTLSSIASATNPTDTVILYNNKRVVISDKNNEVNVMLYHQTEEGDTIASKKIYEGIFTDEKNIERVYENSFEISVPDIFKPKSKRRPSRSHWAGFGLGFSNLPHNFDFNGEMALIVNLSRSLQYNLNPIEGSRRLGNSNFTVITGMGIQFNAIHWQRNKAIEAVDYKSVITTTAPGNEYRDSRLHFTYLTFPLLIETNWDLGNHSHFFLNAGVVAKIKTASSSAIWQDNENGKKKKTKLPGEMNIRPVTLDIIGQGGINDIGFFASYSPFSLFRNNKGPDANQATIGIQYYF